MKRQGEFRVGERPATWVRDGVLRDRPLLILAHGAGAPLGSPFMEFVAQELVGRGLTVARFHFPYMESFVRTSKRRPPNSKATLLDTWEAMLAVAQRWRRSGPVIVGGKSMGGRIASMLLAAGRAPEVAGAVYLGYPLHPPGKPEKLRTEHLPDVKVPQLFVSGSRDALCRLDLLQPVLKKLKRAELLVVENADHSLARGRREPFADADVWLAKVEAFCKGL